MRRGGEEERGMAWLCLGVVSAPADLKSTPVPTFFFCLYFFIHSSIYLFIVFRALIDKLLFYLYFKIIFLHCIISKINVCAGLVKLSNQRLKR